MNIDAFMRGRWVWLNAAIFLSVLVANLVARSEVSERLPMWLGFLMFAIVFLFTFSKCFVNEGRVVPLKEAIRMNPSSNHGFNSFVFSIILVDCFTDSLGTLLLSTGTGNWSFIFIKGGMGVGGVLGLWVASFFNR